MGKYVVKAVMVEGNPEFGPDEKLVSGLECDGYLVMTAKNGKCSAKTCAGVTVMELACMLADDSDELGSLIRQAIVIAEGLRKASDIHREYEKNKAAQKLAAMFNIK